jgi:hypothetical protein
MLNLIVVVLSQAAFGPPAPPPETPQTEQATPQGAATPAQQSEFEQRHTRRCRLETTTGSRLGARVCMTQAEREALETDTREFLRDHQSLQDNGYRGP